MQFYLLLYTIDFTVKKVDVLQKKKKKVLQKIYINAIIQTLKNLNI